MTTRKEHLQINKVYSSASSSEEGGKGPTSDLQNTINLSRRRFLGGTTGALLANATGLGIVASPARVYATEEPVGPLSQVQRQLSAQRLRIDAAGRYLARNDLLAQQRNDDEVLFDDFRAVFSKCLPHFRNSLEVKRNAYKRLLKVLDRGTSSDFNKVKLSPFADRRLANPQAAYSYDLTGGDAHESRIAPAPNFTGAEQAAEMAEVYWHAVTRDVPFSEFSTSDLVADACLDLNQFTFSIGPSDRGLITPATIFRGGSEGDLKGPYISQFLWHDVPYGPSLIEQRYRIPLGGVNFLENKESFRANILGAKPSVSAVFDLLPRYINSQRALGEYVHADVVAQAYTNAALIALQYGSPAMAPTNPYLSSDTQGGFITFGVANILDLIGRAATIALKTAWYQKWLVHRRLRPEVFAFWVEQTRNGSKNYSVHPDVLNSEAVARVAAANSTGAAFLPMAYEEGSPTHPAYPAGHACIAGACTTILKAFFNQNFVVPNPVVANSDGTALLAYDGSLTIGNELNKLASNISIGRDTAGVHYRSDGIQGIAAGEQVALRMLQDVSLTYNEDFPGFFITGYDDSSYQISKGELTLL